MKMNKIVLTLLFIACLLVIIFNLNFYMSIGSIVMNGLVLRRLTVDKPFLKTLSTLSYGLLCLLLSSVVFKIHLDGIIDTLNEKNLAGLCSIFSGVGLIYIIYAAFEFICIPFKILKQKKELTPC